MVEPPAITVLGEAEQDRISPLGRQEGPVQLFATLMLVHGPQLSVSSDSAMAPIHEALLSAHARAYQVPAVGNAYEA